MAKDKAIKESSTSKEDVTRSVILEGLTDIMFDRYAGDNDTKLEVQQKLYFSRTNPRAIVFPSLNIMSFLSAENTTSAPKRLMDSRKYKKVTQACRSYLRIAPMEIPFFRDGKPIVFGKFDGDVDAASGIYIHRSVARLKDGIPNPKERPVLPTPWELHFELTLEANDEIQEQALVNLIQNGGKALGLGTFRGVFASLGLRIGCRDLWRGWAGHGESRLGSAGRGEVRRDKAKQGEASNTTKG